MPLAPLGITVLRFTEEIAWSRERESDPQSTAYKAVAQPLCYRGSLASTVVSLLQEDYLVAVDARWDTCPSKIGGEGGFRSPISFRTSVFKTDAFADSATSPNGSAGRSCTSVTRLWALYATVTPPRD